MLYDACGALSLRLAAALAYYVNLRRRWRSLQREIAKVKQRMAARRRAALARFVMLAASHTDQRRHVERASGKWRGSTLSGYLRGDDQTYVENFHMTRATFDKLLSLLAASEFALSGGMPGQGVSGGGREGASKRSDIRYAQAHTDPPSTRFKLATCLYAMGQGGRSLFSKYAQVTRKSIFSDRPV